MNDSITKKWKIISLVMFGLLIFSVSLFVIFSDWIIDKKSQAIAKEYQAEIREKNLIISEYKKRYEDILRIRDMYRNSIKEITDLLYEKDIPMSVGSINDVSINENDQNILLSIRNTINTMEDDQKLLSSVKNYLKARKQFISSFPFIWPIKSNGVPKITSGFGFRDDLFHDGKVHFHEGIDIRANIGDPILATADGKVLYVVRDNAELGKIIVLEHEYGFTTAYAHLSKVLVKKNQIVKRGQIIGEAGESGKALGPHLHYEIHIDGTPIDPLDFLSVNF